MPFCHGTGIQEYGFRREGNSLDCQSLLSGKKCQDERKLHQRRFRLYIGNDLFTERVIRYCNRLPREIAIPGSIQKACKCNSWPYSLVVDVVVLD